MRIRPYFRWLYASPFSLLLIGSFSYVLKLLDWIGKAQALMSFPEWMSHPLFGFVFIGMGFGWLVILKPKPKEKGILLADGTPYESPKHPLLGVATCALTSAIILTLPIWFFLVSNQNVSVKDIPGSKLPAISKTAVMPARYFMRMLPISIDPKSTVYVLQLNPHITEGLWQERNENPQPKIWPKNVAKGILDQIYLCELTNQSDKAYLNVSLAFNTAFFEVKDTGMTVTEKKNKDGTSSMTLPLATGGKTGITFHDKAGNVKTQGKLFKSFLHPIVIPAIAPKDTVRIYLINQSRFIAGFDFPKKATALSVDGGDKIEVTLLRSKVDVLDTVPLMLLPPPQYRWVGVPDSF